MALHIKSTGIDWGDFSDSGVTGASTVSELYDDYEEGTWTPKMFGASATQFTTNHATGNFNKSGAFVYVMGRNDVTSINSAVGHMYVSMMPFTSSGSGPGWSHAGFSNISDSLAKASASVITFGVEPGASHAYLYNATTAGSPSMNPSHFSNNGHFRYNLQFLTA